MLKLSEAMEHCKDVMNGTFHDSKGGESSAPRRLSVSKDYDTSKQREKNPVFLILTPLSHLFIQQVCNEPTDFFFLRGAFENTRR
jgi:hypothetical protein